MKSTFSILRNVLAFILLTATFACKKESANKLSSNQENPALNADKANGNADEATSNFNLEVVLQGEGNNNGHIHFRQDPDPAKIITLDTKVHNLLPNHEYQLQRAVDAINVVDGNCTSTAWLTLGHGLTPQSIFTNNKGDGEEELWRDVSAVPSGSSFDIHFQIIDAVTHEVVLTSDCYQYTVR